jgi:hypothetical protein
VEKDEEEKDMRMGQKRKRWECKGKVDWPRPRSVSGGGGGGWCAIHIREKRRKRKRRRGRLFLENGGASDEGIPKSVDVKGFSYTPVHDVEVDVLQEEQCRGNHRLPTDHCPWKRPPPSFQTFAFKCDVIFAFKRPLETKKGV